MRICRAWVLGVALAAVGVAGVAGAAEKPAAKPVAAVAKPAKPAKPAAPVARGTAVSVETAKGRFGVDVDGAVQTFHVGRAKFFMDGKAAAFTDLRAGDRVRVRYRQNDDRKVAVRVDLWHTAPAAAAAKTGTKAPKASPTAKPDTAKNAPAKSAPAKSATPAAPPPGPKPNR
jgi:hypothetical protein